MTHRATLLILLLALCLVGTLEADEGDDTPFASRHPSPLPDASLLPDPGEPPIRIEFRGRIDGSERIVISQAGAHWENVHWGTSKTRVTLNGVAWEPRSTPFLRNGDPLPFLAADVDFSTARLESGWRGRDTVALSPGRDCVTVRIADNPNGADEYEFTILFRRGEPSTHLLVQARIEGSDDVVITRDGARWKQRHWGWPHGAVRLNGVSWEPRENPWLSNWGATYFLPDDVDLGTARLVHVAGRDLATLETADDQLILRFADTPPGPANYLVLIRFDAPN